MKKSTRRTMNLVAILILGFNVAGVISILIIRSVLYPGDLLENGSLLLESNPAPGTSVADVKTCTHANELIVTGHIRRQDDTHVQRRGEVTITLLSPGGGVLERRSAWYELPPGLDRQYAHFKTRFRASPPRGSVLRIESTEPEAPHARNPVGPESRRPSE